jgi:magnesium-transporting ATPase (P-type)
MLSELTLDHQAVDKRTSKNHAAEPVTVSDAATLPLSDLLRNLHSSETGLSTSDATDILKRFGANRIDTAKRKAFLLGFIERFTNPLVLILLFAAAVSAFTGDVPSFLIIAFIVLMSVILDVTQEYQAQRAADSLRKQVSLLSKVLRDGCPVDIPQQRSCPAIWYFWPPVTWFQLTPGWLKPATFMSTKLSSRARLTLPKRR